MNFRGMFIRAEEMVSVDLQGRHDFMQSFVIGSYLRQQASEKFCQRFAAVCRG